MPRPIDIWGPRPCPTCHVEPGEHCLSASGRRSERPHAARYPPGIPDLYGEGERQERGERRLRARVPLDVALRQAVEERQEAFRSRSYDEQAAS